MALVIAALTLTSSSLSYLSLSVERRYLNLLVLSIGWYRELHYRGIDGWPSLAQSYVMTIDEQLIKTIFLSYLVDGIQVVCSFWMFSASIVVSSAYRKLLIYFYFCCIQVPMEYFLHVDVKGIMRICILANSFGDYCCCWFAKRDLIWALLLIWPVRELIQLLEQATLTSLTRLRTMQCICGRPVGLCGTYCSSGPK